MELLPPAPRVFRDLQRPATVLVLRTTLAEEEVLVTLQAPPRLLPLNVVMTDLRAEGIFAAPLPVIRLGLLLL